MIYEEMELATPQSRIIYHVPADFYREPWGDVSVADEYAFSFNPEGVQSHADWIHAAARWNAIIAPILPREGEQ